MEEGKQYTLKELKEKLTNKERIFCHQYIIDWNGARAAREAGYSEDSAKDIAYQNSTKLYIQQYIEFIKNDFEKECGISKTRQLNELSKIAYSSIAHLHNTWIELKDFELLTPEQKAGIESIDTKIETKKISFGGGEESQDIDTEIKFVKIKLYSKISAIQEINKMMGYNAAEKFEHSGEIKTELSEAAAKAISKDFSDKI